MQSSEHFHLLDFHVLFYLKPVVVHLKLYITDKFDKIPSLCGPRVQDLKTEHDLISENAIEEQGPKCKEADPEMSHLFRRVFR